MPYRLVKKSACCWIQGTPSCARSRSRLVLLMPAYCNTHTLTLLMGHAFGNTSHRLAGDTDHPPPLSSIGPLAKYINPKPQKLHEFPTCNERHSSQQKNLTNLIFPWCTISDRLLLWEKIYCSDLRHAVKPLAGVGVVPHEPRALVGHGGQLYRDLGAPLVGAFEHVLQCNHRSTEKWGGYSRKRMSKSLDHSARIPTMPGRNYMPGFRRPRGRGLQRRRATMGGDLRV